MFWGVFFWFLTQTDAGTSLLFLRNQQEGWYLLTFLKLIHVRSSVSDVSHYYCSTAFKIKEQILIWTHLLCERTLSSHWIWAGPSDPFSFSWWRWRRCKDFNPQWNFLIPATCHRVHWLHAAAELLVGVSPLNNTTSSAGSDPVKVRGLTEVWMPSVVLLCQWVRRLELVLFSVQNI